MKPLLFTAIVLFIGLAGSAQEIRYDIKDLHDTTIISQLQSTIVYSSNPPSYGGYEVFRNDTIVINSQNKGHFLNKTPIALNDGIYESNWSGYEMDIQDGFKKHHLKDLRNGCKCLLSYHNIYIKSGYITLLD